MYYPKADYLEKVKAITSYFRKEMANMWWSIGGGIIIFALGMFIFLKPGLIWKLTEEWKSYRADEPSEFYLKATKIGGALFALFGIIMIMLPFILEWQFQVCKEQKLWSYRRLNMIWQQVLYALKDFLIKRLGSLLEHTT